MDKFAVAKFVNYKTSNEGRAKRLSGYIRQLASAEPKYLASQYMTPANSEHSLAVIEKRWHPKGTRMFKQGILSFGATTEELKADKALEITREILGFFESYPWLAAIHTNKPSHIHAHFLLGMTNVRTGAKYSQGPQELRQFVEHYNKVARKRFLPLLKGHDAPNEPLPNKARPVSDAIFRIVDADSSGDCEQIYPVYCQPQMAAPMNTGVHVAATLGEDLIGNIVRCFQRDFDKYFLLGLGKDDFNG